jgi:Amt family ammonium transporter
MRMKVLAFGLLVLCMITPTLAEGPTAGENSAAIDTIWVLIAAFLVFFMQAGFAMVETGLTRAKNMGNILMKNIMDFSIGTVSFFILGFGIMFGMQYVMLGNADSMEFGIPLYAFWIFQAVFAATAATIVSGAMAERTKFSAYLGFSAFITLLIYPLVGNWIWGGGWLSDLGFMDFAGSTVVHSVGAWAGLAGALVLGPRIGKYRDGKPRIIPGHNIGLAALGGFILWFGWFGFNPGSTLSGTTPDIATIAVTTNIAAAAAALTAMFTIWKLSGKPDVSMTINGFLAGLVAITAGCAFVSPGSALVIGAIAGVLVVVAVEFIDKKLKVDDPVGAISVHGICGAFGTLMVGFFAEPVFGGSAGLLFGGGIDLLLSQLIGVVSVFGFVFIAMLGFFKLLDKAIGIRVTEHEEVMGLDIGEHGMVAYPEFEIPG